MKAPIYLLKIVGAGILAIFPLTGAPAWYISTRGGSRKDSFDVLYKEGAARSGLNPFTDPIIQRVVNAKQALELLAPAC